MAVHPTSVDPVRPPAAAPPAGPPPLGESLRAAVRAWVWSRVLVWVAGLAGLAAFGREADWRRFDPQAVTQPFGPVGDALVAPGAAWDAVWFVLVAADGYDDPARAAFFPLYPLLAWAAGLPLGSPLLGALAVSAAAGVAALALLHRLAALELGRPVAGIAVTLVAFAPTAGFLSAAYSESLFLALALGAFLAARRGSWWTAGALGALAAATRSVGVTLVLPLVILYAYGPRADREVGAGPDRAGWRRLRPVHPLRRDAAALALVPLGTAAFCLHLGFSTGDPWAPFAAQEVWFRSFAGPLVGAWDGAVAAWDGLRQLGSGAREPVFFERAGGDPFEVARRNLTDFAFLVFAGVALVGAARRLPLAYPAWAACALALPLSYPVAPQPLMSMPRFVLVLFPLWLWLALVVHERRAAALAVGLSAGLLGVASAEFAAWRWIA